MTQYNTVVAIAQAAIGYDCGGEPYGPTYLILDLALETGQISQFEYDKLCSDAVPRWIKEDRLCGNSST